MDISGKAPSPRPGDDRKGGSFAESMRKEGAVNMAPRHRLASMSFQAGDLATSFSWLSPDFMPASGEGMLEAIALGKGANDEMQRYEEETKRR